MNLKIVFEDAHLLVFYKPAGVPVQSAGIGVKDCESVLKNYLHEKMREKKDLYLGVVHRLDQPVEGLLAFAKTPETAASLNRQNADGRLEKRYLAVCCVDKRGQNLQNRGELCGKPTDNVENTVDKWIEKSDFLRKNGKENRSEIVRPGTPGAKKAVLFYRTLKREGDLELREIRLQTGRHHQIRVQMAGMGTPLAGDRKYGMVSGGAESVDNLFPALCAYHLELTHPQTKERLIFEEQPRHPLFSKFLSIG